MEQVYKHICKENKGGSRKYQTVHHNDSFYLLFAKRQRQSFEINGNNSPYLELASFSFNPPTSAEP